MKKTICLILIVCIITTMACVMLCGCNKDKDNTIKMTEVTHSVFYSPFYVALQNGYFTEENLTIQLSNGNGADNCMTAIISGQADVGLLGPEAAIFVSNEGRKDYPIIFAQLTKKDGSFLMGRTAQPDFKWTDLKDKEIIGGRRGGVPAMTLEYAIKKNNLVSGTDFKLNYDIKYELTGPAFESGTGDYCTMFEPAASNMQKAGKGYIVASVGKEAGDMPFTAFMATKSYIKNNRAKVEAFTRAIIKGIDYVKTHTPTEIAKVVAPSFDGTDIETLRNAIQSYKDIDAFCTSPIMLQKDFEHLQDVIVDAGIMTKRADYKLLVDNSIVEELLKK